MKKLMSAILALLMVLSVASFAGAESEPIKLTWAMGTGDPSMPSLEEAGLLRVAHTPREVINIMIRQAASTRLSRSMPAASHWPIGLSFCPVQPRIPSLSVLTCHWIMINLPLPAV